ncbi:MAG: hypothetical protein F7C82_05225 [Desulfurococcales archaeon]|nr:hypothetical protein [Desulfurococcales archaeon]MCE4627086.1 hypothetical protein [Desulfurococcales archaeon]MCE4629660.1 hypothetical protein [Desulfurococcales archaeon]
MVNKAASGDKALILVALLAIGIVIGYLGARTKASSILVKAEDLMTFSVYAIILIVGIEGGRSLTRLSGSLWDFGVITVTLLFAAMAASFAVAIVLRRLRWMCK